MLGLSLPICKIKGLNVYSDFKNLRLCLDSTPVIPPMKLSTDCSSRLADLEKQHGALHLWDSFQGHIPQRSLL